MKTKLEDEFKSGLLVVFEILQNNPTAIVDDTAIERLLNIVQDVSGKLNLSECCAKMIDSNDTWSSPAALSFAMRCCGHIGASKNFERSKETIVQMLPNVPTCTLFQDASVQSAFFHCLSSLTRQKAWTKILKQFIDVAFRSLKDSFLYVKKAAMEFLIGYLSREGACLDIQTEIKQLSSDGHIFDHLLCIAVRLLSVDVALFEEFLACTQVLFNGLKMAFDSSNTLAASVNLFAEMSKMADGDKIYKQLNWSRILSCKDTEVSSTLISFIVKVKEHEKYFTFLPALCEGLLQTELNESYFSESWNSTILEHLLTEPTDNHSWKNQIVNMVSVMSQVDQRFLREMVECDCDFVSLVLAWRKRVLDILMTSMGLVASFTSISLVNDRKVTRVCCAYLKHMNVQRFTDDDFTASLSSCLFKCLLCTTDVPQITGNLLEVLQKFICDGERFFVSITSLQEYFSFAELLNMKLCDGSWEVKDSLLGVITVIVQCAHQGSEVHAQFLKRNQFWCKILHLLRDNESYVRAKALDFLSRVLVCSPLWCVFETQNNLSFIEFWMKIRDDFTRDSLQDDFITRRSVLDAITYCIVNSNILDGILTNENDLLQKVIFDILRCSVTDLDWEVRKRFVLFWSTVVTKVMESFQRSDQKTFADLLIQEKFALPILQCLCDFEYFVRMETVLCLRLIKQLLQESGNSTKQNEQISSFECYEKHLKTLQPSCLTSFLNSLSLTGLANEIEVCDVAVKKDPLSFVQDIIASSKDCDSNLLDCY